MQRLVLPIAAAPCEVYRPKGVANACRLQKRWAPGGRGDPPKGAGRGIQEGRGQEAGRGRVGNRDQEGGGGGGGRGQLDNRGQDRAVEAAERARQQSPQGKIRGTLRGGGRGGGGDGSPRRRREGGDVASVQLKMLSAVSSVGASGQELEKAMSDPIDSLPQFQYNWGSRRFTTPSGATNFDLGPWTRGTTAKDIKDISVDLKNDLAMRGRDPATWMVGNYISTELTKQRSQLQLQLDAQNSFLPRVTLHNVMAARHKALEAAVRRKLSGSSPVSDGSRESLGWAVPLRTGGKLNDNPFEQGPAVMWEDKIGRTMENARWDDAMLRMKQEVYSNRLRGRSRQEHFTELGQGFMTPPDKHKNEFRYFYDGDDLRFLWRRPVWTSIADERRGKASQIGLDLDADKSRALFRFVRRVANLSAPETVGDVQRLLAEQRNLAADMDQEFAGAQSAARAQARSRRQSALASRNESFETRMRELTRQTQPLEERLVARRRGKRKGKGFLFPDELAAEAKQDVASAHTGLVQQQDGYRKGAFHDERLDKLQDFKTPLQALPEHKRPTDWLDRVVMPGALEDSRLLNPFDTARDPFSTSPEEEQGRHVSEWDLVPGSSVSRDELGVAWRITSPFDYARATDRVREGLQEKAISDWRPPPQAWLKQFNTSTRRRLLLDRRPITFWSRENPDLRMTTEWDDVIGAPFVDDNPRRGIDRTLFYELRARWERRKAIALKFGLEPKPDETIAERNERRSELDRVVQRAVDEGVDKHFLSALWTPEERDKTMRKPMHGTRDPWRFGFKEGMFPLSLRDPRSLLKLNALPKSGLDAVDADKRLLTAEEADEQRFLKDWMQRDADQMDHRLEDDRTGYLKYAGFLTTREGVTKPFKCKNYAQIQDALWEQRVYTGAPEPTERERTWIEDKNFVDARTDKWWEKFDARAVQYVDAALLPEYRAQADAPDAVPSRVDLTGFPSPATTDSFLGWKTPQELDKWRPELDGAKNGYELPREMTYPVEAANNMMSFRWLAKTPWDRIAAKDITSKILRPEDDGRHQDLGPSFYFHRNRIFYRRMPVQRLRHYGAELREAKDLSERLVPQEMASKIKNFYAVARHSQVPFFSSKHVTRNGPRFVTMPKVQFTSAGLQDDTDDYVRVNPHLEKWEHM
eukprot:Hpha_TRINITY_DN6795_c0_g1::TRINITY_DN6795_c0_g1_i1::g.110957::m.110957